MTFGRATEPDVQRVGVHKYWHYLLVASALAIIVSVMALLNAYLDFNNASSYSGISP